jgi:hypothetical protein
MTQYLEGKNLQWRNLSPKIFFKTSLMHIVISFHSGGIGEAFHGTGQDRTDRVGPVLCLQHFFLKKEEIFA